MSQPTIHIASIVSLPFEENTFIAHWDGRDDALVFDPGLEPAKIFAYLEEMSLHPAAIGRRSSRLYSFCQPARGERRPPT